MVLNTIYHHGSTLRLRFFTPPFRNRSSQLNPSRIDIIPLAERTFDLRTPVIASSSSSLLTRSKANFQHQSSWRSRSTRNSSTTAAPSAARLSTLAPTTTAPRARTAPRAPTDDDGTMEHASCLQQFRLIGPVACPLPPPRCGRQACRAAPLRSLSLIAHDGLFCFPVSAHFAFGSRPADSR
ncbi:hypothetical protein VTH06DRAFT_6043 [Thermothelomyces fergusii]